jgi:predicted metal-binding membrane protein
MTRAARERWRIQAPVLAVCAGAWILIVALPNGEVMHHAGGGAMMHGASRTFGSWMLMMAAMMSPLVIAPTQHVHNRSFSRRRGRAVLLFLVSYGAVWTVIGFGLMWLISAVGVRASGWAVVVAGLIALMWQVSPLKQWCLNRCHGHRELVAFGAAADVDAVRFGLQHAVWCVGSCWALMLLPMALMRGHEIAMAAAGLWLFAERLERPAAARWGWRGPRKAVRIVVGQAKMVASMNSLRNLPLGS